MKTTQNQTPMEIKPDVFHQLREIVKDGLYSPENVYRDYYLGWDYEQRESFTNMLVAGMVKEKREGRWYGDIYENLGRCYTYLEQKRCMETQSEEAQQADDSKTLTEKIVESPRTPENRKALQLTERQEKIFERAISAGLMKKTDTGYKWLYGEDRGKVRLAYFLNKVFDPDGDAVFPFKKLECLFGVIRLDLALYQFMEAKNPQKWIGKIDEVLS